MEYIIPIVGIEAIGDYNLGLYASNNKMENFINGLLSYTIILCLFVLSIRNYGLAWSNTAWDGWSTLATSAVAITLLNERPTTREIIGIFLTSIGLIFLGFKEIPSVKGK